MVIISTMERTGGDAGRKQSPEKAVAVDAEAAPSFVGRMQLADKEIRAPLSIPIDAQPHSRSAKSTKIIEKQKKLGNVKHSRSSHSSLTGSPGSGTSSVDSVPTFTPTPSITISIGTLPSTATTSRTVSASPSASSAAPSPAVKPNKSIPIPPPLPLPLPQSQPRTTASNKKWFSPPPSLRPSPLHININTPSPSAESVALVTPKGHSLAAPKTAAISLAQVGDRATSPGSTKPTRRVRFGGTTRINLSTPAHSVSRVESTSPSDEPSKTSGFSSANAKSSKQRRSIANKSPEHMDASRGKHQRPKKVTSNTSDRTSVISSNNFHCTSTVNISGVENHEQVIDDKKTQPPAFNYRNNPYNKLSPDEVEAVSRVPMRPPHEMMVTGGAENSVISVALPSPSCPRNKSNIGPQYVTPFPLTVPPGTDPGKFLPSKTLDQVTLERLPSDGRAKNRADGENIGPRDVLPFPMTVAPGTDPGIFMPSWPPIVPGCHPCPVDPLSLRISVPAARGPSPVIKGHHYLVESLGTHAFRTPTLNPGYHVHEMIANDYAVNPHEASTCDELAAKLLGVRESTKTDCSTDVTQHGSNSSTKARKPHTPKHTASTGAGGINPMESVLNELLPVLDARRKMAERYEKETMEMIRREMELARDKFKSNQSQSISTSSTDARVANNNRQRGSVAASGSGTSNRRPGPHHVRFQSTKNKGISEFQQAYNRIICARHNL